MTDLATIEIELDYLNKSVDKVELDVGSIRIDFEGLASDVDRISDAADEMSSILNDLRDEIREQVALLARIADAVEDLAAK